MCLRHILLHLFNSDGSILSIHDEQCVSLLERLWNAIQITLLAYTRYAIQYAEKMPQEAKNGVTRETFCINEFIFGSM